MLSGEIKKEIIEVIQKIVGDFQERRSKISDEEVLEFQKVRKLDFEYEAPKEEKKQKKDKKRGGMTKADKAAKAAAAAAKN